MISEALRAALAPLIVSLVGALPVYHEDRKPEVAEAKAAQLETLSDAVAAAVAGEVERNKWPGEPIELAALDLAWANHETHFSLRIGAGECKEWECDATYRLNGRTISRAAALFHGVKPLHRAVSFWQLHERTCTSVDAWREARTDVFVAAREATRAIVRARWACRSLERGGGDFAPMVFNALAGRGCTGYFSGTAARVATFRRLMKAAGR